MGPGFDSQRAHHSAENKALAPKGSDLGSGLGSGFREISPRSLQIDHSPPKFSLPIAPHSKIDPGSDTANGSLVSSGKNFYDPESERQRPDGRLSLESSSIAIPLHRVARVIALQATETRYLDRLAVKMDGLTRFVRVKDIEWIEAAGSISPSTPQRRNSLPSVVN